MSAVDLTLLLKDFPSPVVTTSEVAALMRGRVDSANKMLGRLTTKGVVKPLAREQRRRFRAHPLLHAENSAVTITTPSLFIHQTSRPQCISGPRSWMRRQGDRRIRFPQADHEPMPPSRRADKLGPWIHL